MALEPTALQATLREPDATRDAATATPAAHPIEAHLPRLRRYARALTGNRSAADDLVPDCALRALSRWHSRRGAPDGSPAALQQASLAAWLATIMHNVWANDRRRASRRPETLQPDPAIDAAGPADAAAAGLVLRDLEAGLQALSDDQRAVLLMVTLEGMTYEEVARVQGIPIGTVMSRLSRARERLRALTEGETRPALRRVR